MQIMIFVGEMAHVCRSVSKILKCRFSSVQLTLDDHTFTAQCKGGRYISRIRSTRIADLKKNSSYCCMTRS